jgi:hypothetical protein
MATQDCFHHLPTYLVPRVVELRVILGGRQAGGAGPLHAAIRLKMIYFLSMTARRLVLAGTLVAQTTLQVDLTSHPAIPVTRRLEGRLPGGLYRAWEAGSLG